MTTPTPLASAPIPELAKKWKVEVDAAIGGSTTPDWKTLRGMNAFQPTLETQTIDTTDFESGQWKGADYPVQLAWGMQLTVQRKKYSDANPSREDPAQAILRKSVLPDPVTGQASLVHVRFYDRFGGPEAYEGWAAVKWEPQSGGPTDAYNVQITLSGGGERLEIANPVAA